MTVSGSPRVLGSMQLLNGFLDGGTIQILGALTQEVGFDGGTGTLLINGFGDQIFSGNASATAGLLPLLQINKLSGTLSLVGTIRTGKNWTYTAGLVNPGTASVILSDSLTVSGSQTLFALTVNPNSPLAKTITLSTGTTLTVAGTLTLDNLGSGNCFLN